MPDGELAKRYMTVPIDETVETVARDYLRDGGGYLAKASTIGFGDQVAPPDDGGGGVAGDDLP